MKTKKILCSQVQANIHINTHKYTHRQIHTNKHTHKHTNKHKHTNTNSSYVSVSQCFSVAEQFHKTNLVILIQQGNRIRGLNFSTRFGHSQLYIRISTFKRKKTCFDYLLVAKVFKPIKSLNLISAALYGDPQTKLNCSYIL